MESQGDIERGAHGEIFLRPHHSSVRGRNLECETGGDQAAGGGVSAPPRIFINQRFIDSKKSELVLVAFSLSSMNSMAASSSMGCSSLRRIHIFCSSSGWVSSSSRRVPERLMLIAG